MFSLFIILSSVSELDTPNVRKQFIAMINFFPLSLCFNLSAFFAIKIVRVIYVLVSYDIAGTSPSIKKIMTPNRLLILGFCLTYFPALRAKKKSD